MRKVGYMPAKPIAYEDMTVVEPLVYMGRLSGLRKEEALDKARGLMAYPSVGRLAFNRIKELSSGQRRGFPLPHLYWRPQTAHPRRADGQPQPNRQIEFIGKVLELAKNGKTFFLSSHVIG